MEWVVLFILTLAIMLSTTKIGTWLRFSFRYVCKFQKLEGIHVINLDGSKLRLLMVLGSLATLPDNVLELLKRKELIVFYGKSYECFLEEKHSGGFNSEDNYIFVWDDGLYGNWDWQINQILHEVGHLVDLNVGSHSYLSSTDNTLHNIYDGEHKYYEIYTNGTHFVNNVHEYFAQSFAEFFLVKGFKEKCPDTAIYMKNVIENV